MTSSRFGLPETAIARIQTVFARHPEVEKAVLYGSRAKGNFRNNSDIDITLHGAALDHRHLLALMNELDDLLLPWMIDLSLFASIDHPELQAHIERVGIVFYRREGVSAG